MIDMGDTDKTAKNTKHVASRIQTILGKKKVDIFVLTHYHVDHAGEVNYGGIWYLMEKLGFIKYEAPEVELIEVEVEKGFAVTGGNDQWEEE